MIIKKNFSLIAVIRLSGHHLIWLLPLILGVAFLQEYSGWNWVKMPFQPVALVGTAVAFYLGFKNNQSYERLWEARKVWGGIVNSSRAWGSYVKNLVTNLNADEKLNDEALNAIHKKIIYRHIAWLYALRSQLLISTEWEHVNQKGMVGIWAKRRIKRAGLGLLDEEITEKELHQFLDEKEFQDILQFKNSATQLIDKQGQALKKLREQNLINDFQHVELQKLLYDFYVHQGKLERIKKFPLPRQYGSMSFIFVGIFIGLLPFGMLPLFQGMGHIGMVLSVPVTALVAWVYLVMELVGDYSENPFEGTANDIPMYSLCRTIEIDLREMLGEKNLPKPIVAKNGILM